MLRETKSKRSSIAAKRTQTYLCNLLLGLLDILVVAIEHVDGLRMGFPF